MKQRIRIGKEIIVDNLTYDSVCQWVDNVIKAGNSKAHFIFSQNILKIIKTRRDVELLPILESADMLIADGVGILYGARIMGIRLKERVNGTNLMMKLIEQANDKGYRVYFFGAKPGVAKRAVTSLKEKYPRLEIAGTMHGYFSREEEDDVIEEINAASPDLLFIGMGSPLQEYILHRNRNRIKVPVCMGVGGSFDVVAGNLKRAPEMAQLKGFEWLYRLIQEPKRVRIVLPSFLEYFLLILWYRLRSIL